MVKTSPSNKRVSSSASKTSRKVAAASLARPRSSQPAKPAAKEDVPNAKLRAAMAEADEMVRVHRARYDYDE